MQCSAAGFGLLRVRSPLLTEYLLVFTPPGTEMFYFPGYARAKRGNSKFEYRNSKQIPKISNQKFKTESPFRIFFV